MKKLSFLILLFTIFIALPAYSNENMVKTKSSKLRQRFEKIDMNGDGLLSKSEMLDAHRERIEKIFIKFDKNDDGNLSRDELTAVKKEMRKKIYKRKIEQQKE